MSLRQRPQRQCSSRHVACSSNSSKFASPQQLQSNRIVRRQLCRLLSLQLALAAAWPQQLSCVMRRACRGTRHTQLLLLIGVGGRQAGWQASSGALCLMILAQAAGQAPRLLHLEAAQRPCCQARWALAAAPWRQWFPAAQQPQHHSVAAGCLCWLQHCRPGAACCRQLSAPACRGGAAAGGRCTAEPGLQPWRPAAAAWMGQLQRAAAWWPAADAGAAAAEHWLCPACGEGWRRGGGVATSLPAIAASMAQS